MKIRKGSDKVKSYDTTLINTNLMSFTHDLSNGLSIILYITIGKPFRTLNFYIYRQPLFNKIMIISNVYLL